MKKLIKNANIITLDKAGNIFNNANIVINGKYIEKITKTMPDGEFEVIDAKGGITPSVKALREKIGHTVKIEVETRTLAEVKEALNAGADIIMLDNMSVEDMKTAVKLAKGKAETECSGNVTMENVSKIIDVGVDYVSSGALTHSAPILDLSLKNLHAI